MPSARPGSLNSSRLLPHFARSGALIAAACCLVFNGPGLRAQSVTTVAIRGTVRAVDGTSVAGARVSVVNTATGFVVAAEVRNGRFLVQGLEVGGPYTITAERIGLQPQRRESVFLQLGEPVELHFVMSAAALPLDTVRGAAIPRAHAHGGTATTIADSLLHRLPTLNRDFYDFVRLVPQVSTRIGFPTGFSGGGAGFRFNNFLINGVPDRIPFANATAAQFGGRSLPIAAVKEYQVLLAPYDVRYGDFAGALVNTVTRSGTNQLQGSVFVHARNDALARTDTSSLPYDRVQFGFSLGGPIVRDRLHFFVAPELQRLAAQANGPYLGQRATMPQGSVPVSAADVARVENVLRTHGLVAGSGGPVENENPQTNVFARLDLALASVRSRIALWTSYSRSRSESFARANDTFPLSTQQLTTRDNALLTSLQVHTALRRAGGGHNELLISHQVRHGDWLSAVRQPVVQVDVPGTNGSVTISTGTHPVAQATVGRGWTVTVIDNLTLPLGAAHELTLGAAAERFRITTGGQAGSFGTWSFASLDALERGAAERYELREQMRIVPIGGTQLGVYAGDQWRPGDRLSLTMGVRADVLWIDDRAPYNPVVDSIFGRRTDAMPRRRVHLSPRLGFSWDPFGTGRNRIRGGAGIFTGRPPVGWLHVALTRYGAGVGELRCGPTGQGPPPAFEPDYRRQPTTCANGLGFATALRDVDLVDPDLRMAQTLRASLAYDRQLASDVTVTAEALVTRNISDFIFVNLNLVEPRAVDQHGRVLYGELRPTGVALPDQRAPQFAEVIDLTNTARNHSYQLTARLEKRFARGVAATASYTHTRARDVQTPLRTGVRGLVNWSSRAVSGRHDDPDPEISLNDVPHRLIVAGTGRAPWRRWTTELAFYYVGESGSPFTYRATGLGRRGDLNADGSNANDPIYVPRDAFDADEIRFGGDAQDVLAQQEAFERFIARTPCLRRQRGRILARNSCREPWTHTTVASVRQAIPLARGALDAELAAFNVLDLLYRSWGQYREAAPAILEHTGQTAEAPAQSIFRLQTPALQWATRQSESTFQLQLALRYRF